MYSWPNVRQVIVKQVKNIVALMLIGANNSGVNRDMTSDQRVSYNPFHHPKVFGGISSIDGMEQSFKFLPITTGVNDILQMILLEYG